MNYCVENIFQMKENMKPCRCAICQGTDTGVSCLSSVTLRAGYGSTHDMETYTVNLCGDCIDRLINALAAQEDT